MAIETSNVAKRTIPDAFREVLLLEQAQRSVEGRSAEQQAKIVELADAVDARAGAAESLSAWDQVPAALVLLRDATVLAVQGLLAARGIELPEPTVEAAFLELDRLIDSRAVSGPPEAMERARGILTNPHYLAFDELPKNDAIERRSDVEELLRWLRQQIDPRSVNQIKLSRMLRLGGIGLAVVGAIAWLVVWGASKAFSPKNIALGASAQLSSRRPDCPGGTGPQGAPASGLVDGSKSGAYDVCTNNEVNPWAVVELQHAARLAKIKVYNRGDCCWGNYDLPQLMEISMDGATYTELARRTTAYTASDPWVVDAGGQTARFVRIRSDSPSARELVLNEIEIFAAK